jgi:hypothetical protein
MWFASTKGALVHMDRPDGTAMDVQPHFHGRPAARPWTPHGARMDARRHADGRDRVHAQIFPIRKRDAAPGAMKDCRSKLLRHVLTELNKPRDPTQGRS